MQIGNIDKLIMNITKPLVLKTDIDINSVNLLVGANGSGKSLMLKYNWIFSMAANYYIYAVNNKMPLNLLSEMIQPLFTYSFDNHNTTGEIVAVFTNLSLEIKLKEGKILSINPLCFKENLEINDTPQFLSTQTRLLTQHSSYHRTKKLMSLSSPLTEADFVKLLEIYKIYDIMFMETVLTKNNKPLSEAMKKRMSEMTNKKDWEGELIMDGGDIYLKNGDKKNSLLMLSASEQSLFVMQILNF